MSDEKYSPLEATRRYFGERHPLFRLMGIDVAALEGGRAETRMPCRPAMCDGRGALHRGAMVTMLDNACGMAVFSALGTVMPIATVDLRVDYLRPIPPGTGVRAVVECVNRTDTMAWIAGRATTDDDAALLLASVSGTFALNTQATMRAKDLAGAGGKPA